MSTDTPRTDAEGAACVTINGMSAVTAGSYVRLFNLSKALEKTLGELGKFNAHRIADQINRYVEKERNELRAELAKERARLEIARTALGIIERKSCEDYDERDPLSDVGDIASEALVKIDAAMKEDGK